MELILACVERVPGAGEETLLSTFIFSREPCQRCHFENKSRSHPERGHD